MKKMKRVGALLLCTAMAMSVFGCAKTTKKTGANGEEWNEEVESAVNEVLKETSEDETEEATEVADKEPDTVITYGDEGKYRYTITIYGCDGVVTKYEGKTDYKEWEDLLDEMVEAGISEDGIEILDSEDDDDENAKLRVDADYAKELKDYLAGKGIDLEEKIGGEIVDDTEEEEDKDEDKEDEDKKDEEGDDNGEGEGEDDFDFGDLFGDDEASADEEK